MGQSYFLELTPSDDLRRVIQKCNTNFKSLAGQKQQQTLQDQSDISGIVQSLTLQIGSETTAREHADQIEANARQQADQALATKIAWVEMLNRDTTSETSSVNESVNISGKTEIMITDGIDQKFFLLVCFPTGSYETYTLANTNQFEAMVSSNSLNLILYPGANWRVYAK